MGPKRKRSSRLAAASKEAAAPRRKRPTRGLLGQPSGYHSGSDDDYQPAHTQSTDTEPDSVTESGGAGYNSHPDDTTSSSSDSAADSDAAADSESGETLAARRQRLAAANKRGDSGPRARSRRTGTTAAPARSLRGRRGRGSRAAAAHTAPAPAGTWQELPAAVLAHIFTAVCAAGALPMAPRLACVCSSWAAAVDATPELWRVLDTSRLPSSSNRPWPGSTSSSPGGGKGSKKAGSSSAAAAAAAAAGGGAGGQRSSRAEAGLRRWLAHGRLEQLRQLTLCCPGSSSSQLLTVLDEGSDAAAGGGGRRRAPGSGGDDDGAGGCYVDLSAALLQQLADACPHLKSVSLTGTPSLKAAELSSVLLSMPALAELRLSGVRLATCSGLDDALRSVIDAAATTGSPALTSLVLEGCPTLGQRVVKALCCPVQPGAAAALGSPGSSPPATAAPAAPAAGSPGGVQPPAAAPAFPHLELLALSYCGGAVTARGMHLQLDTMQAAMPNLQELRLSGLGGMYGFTLAAGRGSAVLPGWPQLRSLHLGAHVSQSPGGLTMRLQVGASTVSDAVLMAVASRSPLLEELDLTASRVTPVGLSALASALAAARPRAPAQRSSSPAAPAADAAAARSVQDDDDDAQDEAAPGAADAPVVPAGAVGGLRLKRLQLNLCKALACDEGLVTVGRVCCDTLEQLVVRSAGPALGDEGVRGLRACTRLESLDIKGSSVTGAGLRDLLAALPPGVLDELHVASCRSLSRGARQAAAQGVAQLRGYLARTADEE